MNRKLIALTLAALLALGVVGGAAAHRAATKIKGTKADDVLTGTPGRDRIWAFAGNDVVNALEGNDRVWAGAGNDTVDGGPGHDRIWGGRGTPGRDTIWVARTRTTSTSTARLSRPSSTSSRTTDR